MYGPYPRGKIRRAHVSPWLHSPDSLLTCVHCEAQSDGLLSVLPQAYQYLDEDQLRPLWSVVRGSSVTLIGMCDHTRWLQLYIDQEYDVVKV